MSEKDEDYKQRYFELRKTHTRYVNEINAEDSTKRADRLRDEVQRLRKKNREFSNTVERLQGRSVRLDSLITMTRCLGSL